MESSPVTLSSIIERKQPDLPRYVVIPARAIQAWNLTGTTAINVALNGVAVERRMIKNWDDDRWFLSITNSDCRRVGIETGDRIELRLNLAAANLPAELAALIQSDADAQAAWEALTPGQKRMLREEIFAAKQPATRERRARKALL